MGNISVGNISALADGEGARAQATGYFYANDDVGTVSAGNLSAQAKGKGAIGYAYFTAQATEGDMGNVTVGSVSVRATGESAGAYGYVNISADDKIGNITVGNVSVIADGKSADASATFTFENNNEDGSRIGTISFGNISMNVKGTNADGYVGIYATSSDGIGNMTVGNIDITASNAAKKAGADAVVYISKDGDSDYGGNLTIGNITVNAASVRGAGDGTMEYDINVTANNYDGNLTVGNITVKGGDGKADNLAVLTDWLDLYAFGRITVGNVDYSGYGGATTTIDVSGFRGAPTITGSAKVDTIYDNQDTNVMTGGSGADIFVLSTSNANKTLASMDKIADFSLASGDRIDLPFVVDPNVNYTEQGGFADFAAFWAAVNAADKQVFVGQITGQNGVVIAIDFNNDNTPDTLLQLVGVGLNGIDHTGFI